MLFGQYDCFNVPGSLLMSSKEAPGTHPQARLFVGQCRILGSLTRENITSGAGICKGILQIPQWQLFMITSGGRGVSGLMGKDITSLNCWLLVSLTLDSPSRSASLYCYFWEHSHLNNKKTGSYLLLACGWRKWCLGHLLLLVEEPEYWSLGPGIPNLAFFLFHPFRILLWLPLA